jgi:hypothetical protein
VKTLPRSALLFSDELNPTLFFTTFLPPETAGATLNDNKKELDIAYCIRYTVDQRGEGLEQ